MNSFKEYLASLQKDIVEVNPSAFRIKDWVFIYSEEPIEVQGNQFNISPQKWTYNPIPYQSKIESLLQMNRKVHGRLCSIKRIDKPTSDSFLDQYHSLGSCSAKVKLGLFLKNELLSVTTFASPRNFKERRSGELLRYCSKRGTTVVGGLDKHIKYYFRNFDVGEIMTYIDNSWQSSNAFQNIGFIETSCNRPSSSKLIIKK